MNGLIPVQSTSSDPDLQKWLSSCSRLPLGKGVVELASATKGSKFLIFRLNDDVQSVFRDLSADRYHAMMPIVLQIQASAFEMHYQGIRDEIEEWCYKMINQDKFGREIIQGGQEQAPRQVFHVAGNLSTISNVSGQNTISVHQEARDVSVSEAEVNDFVRQYDTLAAALPPEIKTKTDPLVGQLRQETHDGRKSAKLLAAIRDVASGVTSNIAASGIITAVAGLIGS